MAARTLLALLLATAPTLAAQGTGTGADPLGSRSMGSAAAPVTVYEMSDFQCPYCRRFALDIFPLLKGPYVDAGKVRWVFINFPITEIHANAAAAAEVALCAGRAGKFWPMHDLLFKYQTTWAPLKQPGAFFLSLADSARIPRADFRTCLESKATRKDVEADAAAADRAGAGSTPTFYIEGGLLVGAQPAPVFRQVLDSILAAKTAPARR